MGKRITNVEVRERSPWGESVDEAFTKDPGRTSTFIGGYSDKRAQFEREARAGDDPTPLQHRFHWVRAERADGSADGRRIAQKKAEGYSKPSWKEVVAAGYKLDDSAAIEAPDGSARLGDLVLMWCPAPVAAARAKRIKEDTRAASDAYQKRVEEAAEDANRQMGRKPGSRGATGAVFEIESQEPSKK